MSHFYKLLYLSVMIVSSAVFVDSAACCTTTGTWSSWSAVSNCSSSCGSCGILTYSRICTSLSIGCPCSGSSSRLDNCNIGVCLFPSKACCFNYSAIAINGTHVCGPQPIVTTDAPPSTQCLTTTTAPCGQWSEWLPVGTCSASCGSCAALIYQRTCQSSPTCSCTGSSTMSALCNTGVCAFPSVPCCAPYSPAIINATHQCTLASTTTIGTTTTTNVTTTTTTTTSTTTSGAAGGFVCNTNNTLITTAQRQAAVNQINNLRSMLAKGQVASPTGNLLPGTNIYQMSYNCSIEASAQAYANNCVFQHSHNPMYGENLYAAFGSPSADPLTDAGTAWWNESLFDGLDDPTTAISDSADFMAGHFTQMAWGLTTSFGCGIAYCTTGNITMLFPGFTGPATLVVCQYLPPGNFFGNPIYTVGATCTQNSNCNALPSSICNTSTGLCTTV